MEDFLSRYTWSFVVSEALWVLISWAFMVCAVLIDLWSGIDKAKSLGQDIASCKLRSTISKIGDYWRLQVFGLMIDVFLSIWSCYPYGTFLVTVACIAIEVRSVIENYKAKGSSASDITKVLLSIKDLKDGDIETLKTYLNESSTTQESPKPPADKV